MSRFTRFELFEHSPPFFLKQTTLSRNPFYHSFPLENELGLALDLLCPTAYSLPRFDFTSQFDDFDAVTDLVQIERTPFYSNVKRVQRRRVGSGLDTHCLQTLCDRVSALELEFDRLSLEKKKKKKVGDRKYTWTAEIKSPEEDGFDRKYKWVAKINDDGRKRAPEKSYKLTAEIKGKGEDKPISRAYTFEASTGDSGECRMVEKKDKKKEEKKKKKEDGCKRVVEIEEPSDHGAIVLRQAFGRRVEKNKGKRKELSLQDAALAIQMGFRAYLIRRSQVLRALRELAIAKTKLRELRTLFNNFSYRRRVARDAEERQRFSEKIIVLLLTVDAIEGADILVRATKKSMVDELEAMLDVVDPQPGGRSLSMKRRTFDMPDGTIQKELAAGVAKVVQMLDEE
nr:BAG family molecular chaperone regulator 7 [Ipomoea batatas]GME10988.1 BAG family molecular chaperone regulator 7 [Ipomoea batatas]